MAESVDSETLIATTGLSCELSNFTISSMAPTLFGRKTENCFTSGPSRFEVVLGKSSGMDRWIGRSPGDVKQMRLRRPIIIELGELDPPSSISSPIFYWQSNKVRGARSEPDWHCTG